MSNTCYVQAIKLVGLSLLVFALCLFRAHQSHAQITIENEVPAILNCSALSTNPQGAPEFTRKLYVQLSKGQLRLERTTGSTPGKEVLLGSVSRKGEITLAGSGEFDDKSSGWTTKLSGSLNSNTATVLRGTLRGGYGKGKATRRCELTFSVPPAELRKRLSAMFELELRQDAVEQQQVQTDKQVQGITSVLKDIILPVTENPGDWMLRVSAVPVQQQQFCRIIDRFYNDLSAVYLIFVNDAASLLEFRCQGVHPQGRKPTGGSAG